jgi:hypothetical protein
VRGGVAVAQPGAVPSRVVGHPHLRVVGAVCTTARSLVVGAPGSALGGMHPKTAPHRDAWPWRLTCPFSLERGWPVGRRSALVRGLPAGIRWNPIASPAPRGRPTGVVRCPVCDDLTPLLVYSARLSPTIAFADGVCGSLLGAAGYQEIHTALAAFSSA